MSRFIAGSGALRYVISVIFKQLGKIEKILFAMSATKKSILIIDDHFESLEFVRSILQLSNRDLYVVGVPSAEEGLLEFRLHPFDLIITDIWLPGISGIELIQQVRKASQDIPIIVISGMDIKKAPLDLEKHNVLRRFSKPLDTDGLLQSVHKALYGVDHPLPSALLIEAPPVKITPEIIQRLETLCADTGAKEIILGRIDGLPLYHTANQDDLDAPQMLVQIAKNFGGSFQLARQLGSDDPFAVHYLTGDKYDLYSANIGAHFVMALFFQADSRRSRIGTIWVFVQRAMKDLLELLENQNDELSNKQTAPTVEQKAESSAAADALSPEKEEEGDEAPSDETIDTVSEPVMELPAVELEVVEEVNQFWEDAVASAVDDEEGLISFEEAQAQGLIDQGEDMPASGASAESAAETPPEIDAQFMADLAQLSDDSQPVELDSEVDLDSYWSEGVEQSVEEKEGLTWEEAVEQGLIKDLNQG